MTGDGTHEVLLEADVLTEIRGSVLETSKLDASQLTTYTMALRTSVHKLYWLKSFTKCSPQPRIEIA